MTKQRVTPSFLATVYHSTDCFAGRTSAFDLMSRTRPELFHLFGLEEESGSLGHTLFKTKRVFSPKEWRKIMSESI